MDGKNNTSTLKPLFLPLTPQKAFSFLFLSGFIVYFNMLFNSFLGDDVKLILQSAQANQLNLFTSFGPNNFNIVGQYRPIPEAYISILYFLFGNTPFFYHLLQLLLHVVASFLLYLIFRKFLSSTVSFFSALIFLVHPGNVESVSYIAQTVSPLFSVFGLSGLLLLVGEHVSLKKYCIGFFLFLCSLLTKETGIIFLFLYFVYLVFFVKKDLIRFFAASFVVMGIYVLLRIGVGHIDLSTRLLVPIADTPFPERFLSIPGVFLYYLKLFFFPAIFSYDQQWVIRIPTISNFYIPLICDVFFIIIFMGIGLFIIKTKKKFGLIFFFFTAWFLAGTFFHLQIFPLDATVSDRWFYTTMMGLIGMLAVCYEIFFLKTGIAFQRIFLALMFLIIALFSIRTMIRNTDWKDAKTLYTHDAKISDNYDIENALGVEYQSSGDYKTALVHFKRSISLRPNEFNLHNIGVTYADLGEFQNAKAYFQKALHGPDYHLYIPHQHDLNTYKSYASILLYDGEYSKAAAFLHSALDDYQDSSELWLFQALAKSGLGDKASARSAAEKAYQLNQDPQDSFVYQHIENNQSFSISLYKRQIQFH